VNVLLIEINPFAPASTPISLGYIAAYLKSEGFGIKILTLGQDTPMSRYGLYQLITSFQPALVGLTAYQRTMLYVIGLAGFIKSIDSNIKIAIGGPQATFMPSAAFAALGLFIAYLVTVNRFAANPITLSLTNPRLIVGLLVGGMVPYLFASLLASGVGKVAFKIIEEVRRQFREIPGLLQGKAKADSSKCVDIAAKGALESMMLPGILAVIIPIAMGFGLGPVALAGLLMGSVVTGLPVGIQTANTGAALDNAKKYIEEGQLGGKGTPAHKAAVIGDTVGDPLKDTIGPSMNILIKLMAVISLVLAPVFATR